MTFEDNIRNWVYLDNQLKILNEKAREIREKKNSYSKTIISHVKQNNIKNSIIEISDGQLKFSDNTVQQNLTFKFLVQCLNELFNEDETKRIVSYIKSKRETVKELDIKRFTNK
tara:strand:- start:605 stop:946 length:342 start_codon:yes stop_codon:yes gene_type:complete